MSYYMGDYYRGDPGIGSFFGRIFRGVSGFITGGPGGALKGLLTPGAAKEMVKAEYPAAAGIAESAGRAVGRVRSMIVKHPVLSAAGAAGAAAGMGALAAKHMHMGRGGGNGKHRRMRVTNPKALRRALRRAYGFEKLAMRTIHLLHPRKKARFGGFKRKRHARV